MSRRRQVSIFIANFVIPILALIFYKDVRHSIHLSKVDTLVKMNMDVLQSSGNLSEWIVIHRIQPVQQLLSRTSLFERTGKLLCASNSDKSAADWCNTRLVDAFEPALMRANTHFSEALEEHQGLQDALEQFRTHIQAWLGSRGLDDEDAKFLITLFTDIENEFQKLRGHMSACAAELDAVMDDLDNPWGLPLLRCMTGGEKCMRFVVGIDVASSQGLLEGFFGVYL